MAVVGEAHIVVRAITTSVKDDIRRGFDGVDDTIKKTGTRIAKTFQSDFAESAESARQQWQKLAKSGFALQTALGTVAGGLSSLVGGLGAVIGAAGGAAASLVAIGSAAVTLGVGLKIASFAMSGISQAVAQATKANGGYSKSLKQIKFDAEEAALSVTRAELNLERAREGLARVADLAPNNRVRREAQLAVREAELALKKAKDAEKNPDAGAGGTDPYAELTPAQKQFAKFLAGLEPRFKALREAAAKGFLPLLETQMKRLINAGLFDILEEKFFDIAEGAGLAVKNFTDIFLSGDNLKDFEKVLSNIAEILPKFGNIFGDSFGAFLSILEAADPLTRRFVGFLEKKTKTFANFLDTSQASGELTRFFNRAGDLGSQFSSVFGNIFGLLGDTIAANFGPVSGGQYMLNWLDEATGKWKDLRENLGKKDFDGYFLSASINSKSILQSIGALIKELGKLGTMREIKDTFDILKTGAPALGRLLQEGVKAGPVLAGLIVQLTRIAAAFADSGQIRVFYGTLEAVAKAAADILENKVVKTVIDIATQLGAVGLAAGTLLGTFKFVFKVIAGVILAPLRWIKAMPAAFAAATTAATRFGIALKGALGIIGLISIATMGAIELNEQWIQSRKDLVTSTEEIRNEIVAGEGAAVGLQKALADLGGGNLGFMVDFPSTMKNIAGQTKQVNINMDDLSTNSDKFRLVLKALTKETTGFGKSTQGTQNWFDKEADWVKIETAIGNTGQALADVAGSSLPDATAEFKNLAEGYRLTTQDAGYLLESMPAFKDSLKEFATSAGLATDDQTLLNIAMQEGSDYADVIATGFAGVDAAAEDAANKVEELKNKILGFGQAQLDTRAAQRGFEEAVDKIRASVKKNGETLDINTEAGRNNQAALDDLARSAKDQALAIYESTGSTDELKASMDRGREALIKAATQMGETEEEAKTLADTLLGTPEEIKITVDANTQPFENKMKGIKTTFSPEWWKDNFPWVANIFTGGNKDGGMIGGYALGGLVSPIRRLAPGGFVSGAGTARSDSIPAMLSNGEYVINARATSANLDLLEAINSNKNVPMAPTINLTINPSASMNERELAAEVSRQLAFEIRRGGM